MTTSAIIMAAGISKRMRSSTPKVIHHLLGKPLIFYALEALQGLCDDLPLVVVGHEKEKVIAAVGKHANFAVQPQQLGTADAVRAAQPLLKGKCDSLIVLSADMPLIRKETLQSLLALQQKSSAPLALLSVSGEDARGFGRVLRDAQGNISGVVEEKVATPEQLAIREYNTSIYCFRADWLWGALDRIEKSPVGEYYLTDAVALAVADGFAVQALVLEDASEAIGINNRVHFAEAEKVLRSRINEHWMLSGVTMVDPERTYIETTVTIGEDTILYPETYLRGSTVVGKNCHIGPGVLALDTQIGAGCTILQAVMEGAVLEEEVEIGPFAHLRKGAHLGRGVHMGNFGEIKNATLAAGVKMGHFSYIGDADIGENVNIGAGTITCNYDGERKNRTVIGEGAFIGSDTMLVAPVKIGKFARTGAGAVITHDVPDHQTVVGVPAKPLPTKNKKDK